MRRGFPPSFWLVLAALCFAGALASWPQLRPQIAWSAHDAAGAPPAAPESPLPVVVTEDASGPAVSSDAAPRPLSRPDLPDETADTSAAAGLPQAGRQVLRCIERGRTVYRDAGGTCAEGPGEPVTLFPTRGVEAPR